MNVQTAQHLADLRRSKGYSQEMLARELGLSRQAVSKWERAESSPDTDNLIALAKLYGVSGTLSVQASSGEFSIKLDKCAPAQMNIATECGDGDVSVPENTGFTVRVTLDAGSFSSDFGEREYDAEGSYEFPNGDGTAAYIFDIDSGDFMLNKL